MSTTETRKNWKEEQEILLAKILENCLKNRIIYHGNYVEIECYNGEMVLMDIEDVPLLKNAKVNIQSNGYVRVALNNGKTETRVHKLIMNPPEGMTVDHINHNKLDNRKENLRICTNRQNMFNRKGKLIYETKAGNYRAKIQRDYKKIGKTFETYEEAEKFIADIKRGDKYGA